MCLITVATQASLIRADTQEMALARNQDGFGFLGLVDGALRAERFGGAAHHAPGMYTETFRKRLAWWKTASPDYLAVHLRQRTHGPRDEATAHPFPVKGANFTGQVMHNGVFSLGQIHELAGALNQEVPRGAAHSDTMQVLELLNAAALSREKYLGYLVALVSQNPFNRVLFWADGEAVPLVINLQAGFTLHEGSVWFSNDWYVSSLSAA